MRKTIDAIAVRGVLAALIGAILVFASPVIAEAKGSAEGTRAEAVVIAPGAGYSQQNGSQQVRALQKQLVRAGERPGPVDGRFGPLTQAAVKRFQAGQGLAVDGIVGTATATALDHQKVAISPGSGYSEPNGSARVRVLQKQLLRAGERPGPLDGRYGPQTEAAVERFQAGQGLAVDGVVGTATGAVLAQRFVAKAPAPSEARNPRSEGSTAKPTPVKPIQFAPVPAEKAKPRANPGDSWPELPGWRATPAIAAVLALLLAAAFALAKTSEGALARALARPDKRRHAGAHIDDALLTAPLRVESWGPVALVSALPRARRPQAEHPGAATNGAATNGAKNGAAKNGAEAGHNGHLALDQASVLGPQGTVNGGKPKDTPIELQAPRNGRPRGRPALADDPELVERITSMRAHGMTLQGIADQLNEEGVPTVRGGVEWRPSSVRGGLGYKRRREPVGSLAAPDESGKEP